MLILYNGKIDCHDHFAEACVIDCGKIRDIGDKERLFQTYSGAELINLHGRLVLPGFHDSHLHILLYAASKKSLRLYGAKSIEEVIARGKEYLKHHPDIIFSEGYNDADLLEKRILTRDDLDKISEDIPIVAYRVCGHIASLNSKALLLAGISPALEMEGGSIDVDESGKCTGVIRENALALLEPLYRKQHEVRDLMEDIADSLQDVVKAGITSISTNDIHDEESGKMIMQAYGNLYHQGKLPVKINHQITLSNPKEVDHFLKNHPEANPFLKIGPLKLFADGSLGAQTAYLSEPYLNDDQKGILCLEPEELERIIRYAEAKKMQVIIHAIGDQAIRLCLDTFEKHMKPGNPLRHAIVHAQITDDEILKKFEKLQIGAIVQPIFIPTDMNIVYSRISALLALTSYAFGTLYRTTLTSFSSDAPVEDFNPLLGIYAAVTRKNLAGNQEYLPEQAVTVREAVDAYTITPAYMTFEEAEKGSIRIGMAADLAVLDNDIFECPPSAIKDTKVVMTIVEGNIVYQKGKE